MDRAFIERAYRKLKGSIYWDKTLAYVRNKVVEFEQEGVDSSFDMISNAFTSEEIWQKLETRIIESIRVLTVPKEVSVEESEDLEMPLVISNTIYNQTVVKKYNNFMDICIEGQIMGALWVMTVGKEMDNQLMSECFGNRLNDNLILSSGNLTESPNLFKPYYEQYENWRDRALLVAEEEMKKGHDVVITMLDLSRYFYNVDLDNIKYYELTKEFVRDDEEKRKLNELMYEIFKKYSSFFSCQQTMLPIGYMPSNIISNYYLSEWDKKVKEIGSTLYYGRYVDDMLIVSNITNKNVVCKNTNTEKFSEAIINILIEEKLLDKKGIGEGYNLYGFPLLHIQLNKFRFFHLEGSGSYELLRKIRDDIVQNSSEFNYIPERIVEQTRLLKIEREDTLNKLRSIKKVEIDKYELSKMIGRRVLLSKFEKGSEKEQFMIEMNKLLGAKELLSNYTLWESILNYYVVNEKYEEIISFSSKVITALNNMDERKNHINQFEYLANDRIKSVKDTLLMFLFANLCRAMALVWGPDVKRCVKEIITIVKTGEYELAYFTEEEMNKYRKTYCISRMVNRNLLPLSMAACMTAVRPVDDKEQQKMYSLEEYLKSKKKLMPNNKYRKYSPYIETPFDSMFTNLMQEIKDNEVVDDVTAVEKMITAFKKNFDIGDNFYLKNIIKTKYIGSKRNNYICFESNNKLEKAKIAIANVRMSEKEVISNLRREKVEQGDRCHEIAEIVNEAIKNNVDFLILPESYVPLEYLSVLQKKAASSDMVIICGVQHFIYGRKAYNITATLIPVITEDFRYTLPFFHKKVYYSPEEKNAIEEQNLVCAEGKKFSLYNWKGITFSPYCCYELTSIDARSLFKGKVDLIIGIEWNKDINYFSNIMEALSRDLYCFCAQSNMSKYGDSRIIQPKSSVYKDIVRIKGGENALVVVGEVDIALLKKARKGILQEGEEQFKPLPAGYKVL